MKILLIVGIYFKMKWERYMDKSITLKYFRKSDYREFIKNILSETKNILIAYGELNETGLPELGDIVDFTSKVIERDYVIPDNEILVYFSIKYYNATESFEKFDSIYEFMDFYEVCQLWFLKDNEIIMYASFEDNDLQY